MIEKLFWRRWVRCFAFIVFLSAAYEQSNSSVKKEVHSTFEVCFVLSHKDAGILLSHPPSQNFSRRVKTKRLAGKNCVDQISYFPFIYKIVTYSFHAVPLS
jgi:hypothetical protein